MTQVVWLSLDPVKSQIDFYPKSFAEAIEMTFSKKLEKCVLGPDFFNATVHVDNHEHLYQTTPGQFFGRTFKQPGYRTVARIQKEEMHSVKVFARRIHGEWRICNVTDAERTFDVKIPEGCVVNVASDATTGNRVVPRIWRPEDLEEAAHTTLFVVWQWCKRMDVEFQSLDDDMWSPCVSLSTSSTHGETLICVCVLRACRYLHENNAKLEAAHRRNDNSTTIEVGKRSFTVQFSPNTCFATQKDGYKCRSVRRVIETGFKLKKMLDAMEPAANYAADSVGEEIFANMTIQSFLCPITHQVMQDPVMTADGHSYEREAIEEWYASQINTPLCLFCLNPAQALQSYHLTIDGEAARSARFENEYDIAATHSIACRKRRRRRGPRKKRFIRSLNG